MQSKVYQGCDGKDNNDTKKTNAKNAHKDAIPYSTTTTNNNLYLKHNLLDPCFLLVAMVLVKSVLPIQLTPISHVTSFAIFASFVCFLGHGTAGVKLLLHDCLSRHNLC